MSSQGSCDAPRRAPSSARRFIAQMRLCRSFYLGLGAPATARAYPNCRVWAATGYAPDLVRELLALYRGEAGAAEGEVKEVNFRCAAITVGESGQRFFFKEFARRQALHDVERALRCSRAHRAWRAAHLLRRLNILTPKAVGRACARGGDGRPIEYLATEWLAEAAPFHMRLRELGCDVEARRAMLQDFARHLRRWNDSGVYLRDLVTNVATRRADCRLEYWLTDLDQLHPIRRLTRRRLLRQMGQLARWSGPLGPEEARAIVVSYLGRPKGRLPDMMEQVLLDTPPAEQR